MQHQPMFSILVSAYRTEVFVGEMVRSVVAQRRGDWELIVVDNGSPDGLAEVVDSFNSDPRIRLVRLPENVGVSAARNLAARLANGEILCVLDSDDVLDPNYLHLIGETFRSHPGVGLVGCRPERIDAQGRPLSRPAGVPGPIDWNARETALVSLLRGPFDYHGAAVAREAFTAINGYNVHLAIGEDADLWIRLAAAGYPVRVLESPLYRYRIHPDSVTANPENAVAVAAGNLVTIQALASAIAMTPDRVDALRENARRTQTAMSLAQMRSAVRRGEPGLARRESRRVARASPSARNLAIALVISLPWPIVCGIYRATGRGRCIGPAVRGSLARIVVRGWLRRPKRPKQGHGPSTRC